MSKMLFLPGVFIKDCPTNDESDVEEIRLSSEDEDDIGVDVSSFNTTEVRKSVIKEYDSIPTQFTTLDKWPKQTNLLCWTCDKVPSDMPWPIIIGCSKTLVSEDSDVADISDLVLLNSLSAFKEILIRDTHGNFCQPSCIIKYIDGVNDPNIVNKQECKRMTMSFIEFVTNSHISFIPGSDSRTVQQKYCGPHGKTEEKYHEDNKQKHTCYDTALEKSKFNSVVVTSFTKNK